MECPGNYNSWGMETLKLALVQSRRALLKHPLPPQPNIHQKHGCPNLNEFCSADHAHAAWLLENQTNEKAAHNQQSSQCSTIHNPKLHCKLELAQTIAWVELASSLRVGI